MTSDRRCENCIAPEGRPCPHWIGAEAGILEANDVTGEERIFVGCSCGAFVARMTRYIIQTNARTAAAAESFRNDVCEAVRVAGKAGRREELLDDLAGRLAKKIGGMSGAGSLPDFFSKRSGNGRE